MFFILQLFSFFLLSVIISLKMKNRIALFLVGSVLVSYFTLEVLSFYLTGNFVDYRFYFHLNINSLRWHGFQFYYHALFLFFISTLLLILLMLIQKKFKRTRFDNRLALILSFIVLLFLFFPSGMFGEKYQIFRLLNSKTDTFDAALRDLHIDPDVYVQPKDVVAEKGKNIIVISVESLERGFLSPRFSSITPHLQKLVQNWTYYPKLKQGDGGGWTVAALYNQQAGMPAFFRGQGNTLFQHTAGVKITGLGHVLERAGYQRVYLMGNAGFAGSADLLAAYRMPVVSERNTLGAYPTVQSGLHDYDLFREAKLHIKKMSADTGKPFALFVSTVGTHFPDGIYDARMEEVLSVDKSKGLEYAVATVDYLIDDFITFLEQSGLSENTALFIFPDHKLMGTTGDVVRALNQEERQLFFLTNIGQKSFKKDTSEDIYQIELPAMILDGAGVDTNAKFLIDFIRDKDIENFLETEKIKLAKLNSASLQRISYAEGIEVFIDRNFFTKDVLTVKSGSHSLKKAIDNDRFDKFFSVSFSEDVVPVDYREVIERNAYSFNEFDINSRRLHMIVEVKKNKIDQVYFGNKFRSRMIKNGSHVSFSSKEIDSIIDGNHYAGIAKETEYSRDKNRFIAHAGGGIEGKKYTNSLEALDLSYAKGYRLFELDIIKTKDDIFVAAHDWKHWADIADYKGELPPSRAEFMRRKIFGKFTPLDIQAINQWFDRHTDAILVTDKVNEPISFVRQFTDKTRLMMELFSWDAVMTAVGEGVRSAMPTGALLKSLGDERIKMLPQQGIADVVADYRMITANSKRVQSLVESGIHVYAFHPELNEEIDEKYIICHQRAHVYGLYVDNWDFSSSFECVD